MKSKHTPSFIINSSIISLIAEISQMIGRLSVMEEASDNLRLRRINRMRTIQGSLAIEGNTLTEGQITAILQGKNVAAPPREIQEAMNAVKAYDQFLKWGPYSKNDLLNAHSILMWELIDEPGEFRAGGVGVMAKGKLIHLAPPAFRVPSMMDNLLQWLKTTNEHPLISSAIFHYEFEFIHPFQDGNGRMGRLWQTLILSKWNPLFSNIPVENIVYKHQMEYYDALNKSTQNAESSAFVDFMLRMIFEAMQLRFTPEDTPEVTPEVIAMLRVVKGEMRRKEIQQKMGLKDEKHFREKYLKPSSDKGFIEMTIPDKPNSRFQKYRITEKGLIFLRENRIRKK